MKGRFTIIEDAFVILRSRGVYRQAKVYERDGRIYAGHGSGFITISASGSTSIPNVRVDGMELGFTPVAASLGYLERPKPIGWKDVA